MPILLFCSIVRILDNYYYFNTLLKNILINIYSYLNPLIIHRLVNIDNKISYLIGRYY